MLFTKLRQELRRSFNLRLVVMCVVLLILVVILEHTGFIVYPSNDVPLKGQKLV